MCLKTLIKNTEARFISYKVMLEDLNKTKNNILSNDFEWYKGLLREGKSSEQLFLKQLIEEKEHFNGGFNPPFCYKKLKKE